MNNVVCRVPIKGLSDVIGIIDETVLRKMVRDSRIVTPKQKLLLLKFFKIIFPPSDSFSPESGGRVKSRTAMEDISRQGTMRLKK